MQPIQILLHSLPTFKQINIPTQHNVIWELSVAAPNLLVQVVDKNVK